MIDLRYDFDELMKTPNKNLTEDQIKKLDKILGHVNNDISAEIVDIGKHTEKLLKEMKTQH